MPTPQILKQIILICLLIHRSTRLLVCAVSMEWMARPSGMRMGYFPSPSFNRLYLWLGGVLSSWRSINGGRTNSMLGIHYLRTLPPPWFLCFAWKPKVRTLKLSSGFFQWWVAVLSRPVWCLSMGVKEFSNLCSSNSIALNLEFWNSLELLNGVRFKRPTHHNIWILRRFAYVNCRNHLIGSNENNTAQTHSHLMTHLISWRTSGAGVWHVLKPCFDFQIGSKLFITRYMHTCFYKRRLGCHKSFYINANHYLWVYANFVNPFYFSYRYNIRNYYYQLC